MKIALTPGGSRLASAFLGGGFTVDRAEGQSDLEDLLASYEYDAVVLEHRPGSVGPMTDLRRVRSRAGRAPILVHGADDCRLRIAYLHAGADDAVACQTEPAEILVRVHAMIRRCNGHVSAAVSIGNLTVDIDAHRATVDGTALDLTAKEFKLLELFALRGKAILNKHQVLNALYGNDDEPDDRIVGVYLCTLRRKLREAGAEVVVDTIRGLGYAMREARLEALEGEVVGFRHPAAPATLRTPTAPRFGERMRATA